MRVLVIGGGSQEHALVARLSRIRRSRGHLRSGQSRHRLASSGPFPADLSKPDELLEIAGREQVDFTIVGPELPLSLGVADRFAELAGRLLFGPTGSAARLESSKAFAKAFMARHHVPTARFQDV